MKRHLLILATALVLLWPCAASATWNAATLLAPQQKMDDGRVQIVVQLSGDNGESSGKIVLYSTDGDFKAQIKTQLAALNRNITSTAGLPAVGSPFDLRDVVVTPPPPPPPPPPSDDDVAAAAFQTLVNTWRYAVVEQQVGAATQLDVDTARAAVAAPMAKASAALRARYDQALIAASRGSIF